MAKTSFTKGMRIMNPFKQDRKMNQQTQHQMVANNSSKVGGKSANSTNNNGGTGNGSGVCSNCGCGGGEQSSANLTKSNKVSH